MKSTCFPVLRHLVAAEVAATSGDSESQIPAVADQSSISFDEQGLIRC